MMRRLDLGIASYQNPNKLDQTLRALRQTCRTDWRCLVVDNFSTDVEVLKVLDRHVAEEPRIVPRYLSTNTGYAGAVNTLLQWATTEYIAYCDNDATVLTEGWDETFASYLDRFHELGMVFPQGGAYPIDRGAYTEILWGVGYCWMTTRVAMEDAASHPSMKARWDPLRPREYFDESLGHQDEVDFQTRLRLCGYKIASCEEVGVQHDATATNNPEAIERISRGVQNWVNKWCRYFGGPHLTYHSPNVLRFEDWPPTALYLEEYWRLQGVDALNANPTVALLDGREYDLIRVPRLKGFYRNRVI